MQQQLIDEIIAIKRIPIKLSGNINSQIRHGAKNVAKFACTLQQAIDLQKDLSNGVIEGIEEAVEIAEDS
jgi:hypothetical protein